MASISAMWRKEEFEGKASMYQGKRISVALASYNGEKYIEEQLMSICSNTVKPDEIIVSDDGSKDQTVSIVQKVANSEAAAGIEFNILTDNTNHGFCGNFEHALRHTTGDYIFLCDQDDIWMPTKVERIVEAFLTEPSAGMIFHDAEFIDRDGNSFGATLVEKGRWGSNKFNRLPKNDYLEGAISGTVINGMCMCVSRSLLDKCFPFPASFSAHDHWISFVAVASDACYYYDDCLAMYRLHGENTCGNSLYSGTWTQKLRRRVRHILSMTRFDPLSDYYLGKGMVDYMIAHQMMDESAFRTAKRVLEVGTGVYSAEQQGRITGAITLCRMYRNDIRYRRTGKMSFVAQLLHVLIISPKRRRERLKIAED